MHDLQPACSPVVGRPALLGCAEMHNSSGRCKLTCCGQEPVGSPYNPGLLGRESTEPERVGRLRLPSFCLGFCIFSFFNIYLTAPGLSCSPWDQVLGFCFSFSIPASRWLSGKEPTCQYVGDEGSIPGSGRSARGGNDNHSSILAWEIAETEEPSGPQSKGLQRARHDLATNNSNLENPFFPQGKRFRHLPESLFLGLGRAACALGFASPARLAMGSDLKFSQAEGRAEQLILNCNQFTSEQLPWEASLKSLTWLAMDLNFPLLVNFFFRNVIVHLLRNGKWELKILESPQAFLMLEQHSS